MQGQEHPGRGHLAMKAPVGSWWQRSHLTKPDWLMVSPEVRMVRESDLGSSLFLGIEVPRLPLTDAAPPWNLMAGCGSGVPTSASLGSTHLLERLLKLRKITDLL